MQTQFVSVGEIGKQIVFDAQVLTPGNLSTLTGATSVSLIIKAMPPTGIVSRQSYTATIGPGGTYDGTAFVPGSYALYVTVGTEFPVQGPYELQIIATFGPIGSPTQSFKSPVVLINVGPAL